MDDTDTLDSVPIFLIALLVVWAIEVAYDIWRYW